MDSLPAEELSLSKILQKISTTPNPGDDNELIEIVIHYLKLHKQDCTRFDAIRWIKNMNQTNTFLVQAENETFSLENNNLTIKTSKEIHHFGLIKYIYEYSIPLEIAKKYLKELKVYNSDLKKTYYVLGFKNEDGGFEIRNPFIKGCVGLKNITFIRRKSGGSDTIHIFKSFWDYLSFLSRLKSKRVSVDCIILNSFVCLRQAISYIENFNYQTVYSWLDNSTIGEQATNLLSEYLKSLPDIRHIPMNKLYSQHLDVSDWYRKEVQNKD